MTAELEARAVAVIRGLAMDAPQVANSGHPGTAMALAPLATVLSTRIMRQDPSCPTWFDRDRFVLSAGHASILLYSMLHLAGYDLDLADLEDFRQWGSRTPGHPELGHTPGVEMTTGPLGQGMASAVGMAMAERHLRSRFGEALCDHRVWVLCSDGDFQEGLSHEAASLAGHQQLGRLICVYDDNRITIDGSTDLSFSDDTFRRFEAYGWHVVDVGESANDLDALEAALRRAAAEEERPSLVILRSHIGWPSPGFTDTSEAHGSPLGVEEVRRTKELLDLDPDQSFQVAPEVRAWFTQAASRHHPERLAWEARLAERHDPEVTAALAGQGLVGWEQHLPSWPLDEAVATRKASGACFRAVLDVVPGILGGGADLTANTGTALPGVEVLSPATPAGRQVHFGIREHAMAAAMNGMALHGGVIPVGGTFFVFADYCRPSIRLAALMGTKVIYSFTHDSVAVGEDGPTHQPVEHLASLRAMPGLTVIRPGGRQRVRGSLAGGPLPGWAGGPGAVTPGPPGGHRTRFRGRAGPRGLRPGRRSRGPSGAGGHRQRSVGVPGGRPTAGRRRHRRPRRVDAELGAVRRTARHRSRPRPPSRPPLPVRGGGGHLWLGTLGGRHGGHRPIRCQRPRTGRSGRAGDHRRERGGPGPLPVGGPMSTTRLRRLWNEGGQSPWLDNIRRSWLTDGQLATWVTRGVRGLTSNPTIFQQAMTSSGDYDGQLRALLAQGADAEEAYWELVVDDIRAACGLLAPVHQESAGADGFVSVEVDPTIARDATATVEAARDLRRRVGAANLLVKVPGTAEGLTAFRQLVTEGVNVNVTLLFSLARYGEVVDAYLDGLEAHPGDLSGVAGVASFFVSRVDTECDRSLDNLATPEASRLRGRAAVANAQLAYALFQERFSGARWDALAARGARPQRPLWASTSTKDPAYPDTLYVDPLIAPETVNTMPESTLIAFEDHGTVARTADAALDDARQVIAGLDAVGVDLEEITSRLEEEGVAKFAESFSQVLDALGERAQALRAR